MAAIFFAESSDTYPHSEIGIRRRQQRGLEAVALAGLKTLVVTSRNHLQYLTEYDGNRIILRAVPIKFDAVTRATCIEREYEVESARAESCIDEIGLLPVFRARC
ncbi:hypothetical protein [Mesorhizobium sp. M0500]|uniref:hypothetical protein n=1 Tax=Mesorhizobium sp. M0500 TaxID=2956953 RepID=UPI00333B0189